ncbi:hypothetical protein IWW48_002251 [Coemansia sp. RSA 1200]|nr:hypothetical protein IWW48_002251 [Coemansia sp. RSA 1200]
MKISSFAVLLVSAVNFSNVQGRPVYKEIAHSIGYDVQQATAVGAAVSDGVGWLVGALDALDQFKPVLYPPIVAIINTAETFGGLISSLAGYAAKLAVEYFYTGSLLNDTPYIGELIRAVDSMIKSEYASLFGSTNTSDAIARVTATPSLI